MLTKLRSLNTQRLHLWCGLFASLWLAILGITGFILDHRDSWHWLWQSGMSSTWLPQNITDKAQSGAVRLYQVSPHDARIELSGGLTGLWWRTKTKSQWQISRFYSADSVPLVYQVLFDEHKQGRVWLATDNGLWQSDNNGQDFMLFAFAEQTVTSITRSGIEYVYAIIDRSRLIRLNVTTDSLVEYGLQPPSSDKLPNAISLSRFVRDLHYGRGVTTVEISTLWNDITGIALLLMPLSGFLFYWLPRRWRQRKAAGAAINHLYKKQTMRWLFRIHGPTLGLLCFIPVLYLAITGIFLDHSTGLRQWMKQTSVTRSFQTPIYNLNGWQGHIYGVAVTGQQVKRISLATRLGLFTSSDAGQTWLREPVWQDKAVFVWTLRQRSDQLFIGGMGNPNFVKPGVDAKWQKVKGHAHMPSDISVRDDSLLLKNRKGLWRIEQGKKTVKEPVSLPVSAYVPWFYVVDGLHSGVLIHEQWKWFNDLIAIIAIILVITGLIRWWKTKWI